MKTFQTCVLLFMLQVVNYLMLTYNYRMIAQARIPEALGSDFLIAGFSFAIIRKVARDEHAWMPWLSYSLGGVLGTWFGIHLSMWLHWS